MALPFDLTPLNAPGCSILASGDILLPTRTDATGAATVTLELPNTPALVGVVFHNQFAVVDPPANGLGLAWSNGGTAQIGRR